MKLKIKPSDMLAVEKHALKTFPYECCGLFMGKSNDEEFEVKKVVKAKNTLRSPAAFEANPAFVYREYKKAERRGLELIGIYHSHPNLKAFVSSRDADFMKYWKKIVWLIVGLSKYRVLERRAFTMRKSNIEELELVVG